MKKKRWGFFEHGVQLNITVDLWLKEFAGDCEKKGIYPSDALEIGYATILKAENVSQISLKKAFLDRHLQPLAEHYPYAQFLIYL